MLTICVVDVQFRAVPQPDVYIRSRTAPRTKTPDVIYLGALPFENEALTTELQFHDPLFGLWGGGATTTSVTKAEVALTARAAHDLAGLDVGARFKVETSSEIDVNITSVAGTWANLPRRSIFERVAGLTLRLDDADSLHYHRQTVTFRPLSGAVPREARNTQLYDTTLLVEYTGPSQVHTQLYDVCLYPQASACSADQERTSSTCRTTRLFRCDRLPLTMAAGLGLVNPHLLIHPLSNQRQLAVDIFDGVCSGEAAVRLVLPTEPAAECHSLGTGHQGVLGVQARTRGVWLPVPAFDQLWQPKLGVDLIWPAEGSRRVSSLPLLQQPEALAVELRVTPAQYAHYDLHAADSEVETWLNVACYSTSSCTLQVPASNTTMTLPGGYDSWLSLGLVKQAPGPTRASGMFVGTRLTVTTSTSVGEVVVRGLALLPAGYTAEPAYFDQAVTLDCRHLPTAQCAAVATCATLGVHGCQSLQACTTLSLVGCIAQGTVCQWDDTSCQPRSSPSVSLPVVFQGSFYQAGGSHFGNRQISFSKDAYLIQGSPVSLQVKASFFAKPVADILRQLTTTAPQQLLYDPSVLAVGNITQDYLDQGNRVFKPVELAYYVATNVNTQLNVPSGTHTLILLVSQARQGTQGLLRFHYPASNATIIILPLPGVTIRMDATRAWLTNLPATVDVRVRFQVTQGTVQFSQTIVLQAAPMASLATPSLVNVAGTARALVPYSGPLGASSTVTVQLGSRTVAWLASTAVIGNQLAFDANVTHLATSTLQLQLDGLPAASLQLGGFPKVNLAAMTNIRLFRDISMSTATLEWQHPASNVVGVLYRLHRGSPFGYYPVETRFLPLEPVVDSQYRAFLVGVEPVSHYRFELQAVASHYGCMQASNCSSTFAQAEAYAGLSTILEATMTGVPELPGTPIQVDKGTANELSITADRPFVSASFRLVQDSNNRTVSNGAYVLRNREQATTGTPGTGLPGGLPTGGFDAGNLSNTAVAKLVNEFSASELSNYGMYEIRLSSDLEKRRLYAGSFLYRAASSTPTKAPRVEGQRTSSQRSEVLIKTPDPANGPIWTYQLKTLAILDYNTDQEPTNKEEYVCELPASFTEDRPFFLDGLKATRRYQMTVEVVQPKSNDPSERSRLREISASASRATIDTQLPASAFLGAFLGGFILALLTIWLILSLRRNKPASTKDSLEELTSDVDYVLTRRFPALRNRIVQDMPLEDLLLKRDDVMLRADLQRGRFGILRSAILQQQVGTHQAGDPAMVLCLDTIVSRGYKAAAIAEAQVLALLKHDGILPIIGVSLHGDPIMVLYQHAELVRQHEGCGRVCTAVLPLMI